MGARRRLAASADAAFVHGMNTALLVCGMAALLSALLVAAMLPDPRPAEGDQTDVAPAPVDAGQ